MIRKVSQAYFRSYKVNIFISIHNKIFLKLNLLKLTLVVPLNESLVL